MNLKNRIISIPLSLSSLKSGLSFFNRSSGLIFLLFLHILLLCPQASFQTSIPQTSLASQADFLSSTSDVSIFIKDHQESVLGQIASKDGNTSFLASNALEPHGEVLSYNKSFVVTLPDTAWADFLSHGRLYDQDLNLSYFRGRWLDNCSSRFLNEDPALNGLNWHSFLGGQYTEMIDPSGYIGFNKESGYGLLTGGVTGAIAGGAIALATPFISAPVLVGGAVAAGAYGAYQTYDYFANQRPCMAPADQDYHDGTLLGGLFSGIFGAKTVLSKTGGGKAAKATLPSKPALLEFSAPTTKGFASDKLMDRHYGDHKDEWEGNISLNEYLKRADDLLSGTMRPNVKEYFRKNGDRVRYDSATNEFGIVTPDGTVRTIFRPKPNSETGVLNGTDYFNNDRFKNLGK